MRLSVNRAALVPFRHICLFPAIFLLSGCFGIGSSDQDIYGSPKLPVLPATSGIISLSGSGAGSTKPADTTNPATGDTSIAPQLEALTAEIRTMRTRFEAMEPAITRLVRVERDMTVLIAEMELLANEPVPFVSPKDLFTPAKEALAVPATNQPMMSQPSPASRQGAIPGETPGTQQGGETMPTLSLGLPQTTRNTPTATGSDPESAVGRVAAIPLSPATSAPPLRQEQQAIPPALRLSPDTGSDTSASPSVGIGTGPGGSANPVNRLYPPVEPPAETEYTRQAALPTRLSCDAFGVHVGSYLLDKSITAARTTVRERHASVLNKLYFLTKEIDLRDGRGVFHRLIAGPVEGFERATSLCNEIKSNGDYCKVTFFDPPECPSVFN